MPKSAQAPNASHTGRSIAAEAGHSHCFALALETANGRHALAVQTAPVPNRSIVNVRPRAELPREKVAS